MLKLEELKTELATLEQELAEIYREGRVLMDCWIAQAKPGSHKNKYPRLKSRKPIFNGKKTEYLSIQGPALEEAMAAIERGRRVKKLQKRIRELTVKLDQWQRRELRSSDTAAKKSILPRYTSPDLIARVRLILGEIDLDPATDEIGQQWVQAMQYYTSLENGLSQPWLGRVWLHPPGQGKTGPWINKLIAEYEAKRVTAALTLVKAEVGHPWFQSLMQQFPACFLQEPVLFLNHQGQPQPGYRQGSAIFYLGPEVQQFKQVFAEIGTISHPA
ncbi:hypothetical protein BST81_15700 [Leptolyngbya sp. 'hensonii']|uniref:hypothetical protein n=1 Tax=Leptolyngbya sp. 'hensonii' TaxID=1922337 RepID=UPI00094FD30C|nr:hypothetical protein [Leptolyngbya sp. 'hensonii']OLP17262.1 hypothetical protein BST81_15700 [Leptolyngbya sp. 'hensonii']